MIEANHEPNELLTPLVSISPQKINTISVDRFSFTEKRVSKQQTIIHLGPCNSPGRFIQQSQDRSHPVSVIGAGQQPLSPTVSNGFVYIGWMELKRRLSLCLFVCSNATRCGRISQKKSLNNNENNGPVFSPSLYGPIRLSASTSM